MTASFFLLEAIQLISTTTIPGVFYGINISLYFLCTQLFYHQYRKAPSIGRRKIVLSFFYNSLLVIMASLELGVDSRLDQLIYIEHGGIDGEPLEFEKNKWFSTISALWLLQTMPGFAIGILSPLMQLWRTWIIWSTSPYKVVVTILPLVLMIAGLSIDIYSVTPLSSTRPLTQNAVGTTLAALNIAFSVSVTLLLVGRIIVVRMRHVSLMGTTSESAIQYTNIIAMLVESYALDAVWSIALTISYALATEGNHIPLWQLFAGSGDHVTVLAFLLVTYRVLLQRAWTPETGRQLSSIQWNRDAPDDSVDEIPSADREAIEV